jgi:hypothetical protein
MLLKWAAAVNKSMTARPTRVAAAQLRSGAAPNRPASLASSVVTIKTMRGAM